MKIMASHPRINETLTSDFHHIASPGMATFDACNGPVATISNLGTRDLVAAKESTDENTVPILDTDTNVEGVKIDNEFSDLSMDCTTQ